MTLTELLRRRAANQGDLHAFTYLEDGLVETDRVSYAQLDERARAAAARLQEISRPGDRALLLFPAGTDFLSGFFGTLYADVIGIPTPPPEASRLKRTGPRLRSIVDDADAGIVVTTSKIRDMINRSEVPVFEGREMRWLAVDEVGLGAAGDWKEPKIPDDATAYLQYTSGSTLTPKGVMIGHDNVLFHLLQLQRNCGYDADSVTVTWMPNFHDYGLVEGLLEPLFNETPCYLMSPLAFVKRPEAWLRAITTYHGTHSQAPNFAYDHCVRRITQTQREGLNLRTWKAAGNAAELINPKVLAAFSETFAPYGFSAFASCPAYGLAEATLLVSSSPIDRPPVVARLSAAAFEDDRIVDAQEGSAPVRTLVGCGRVFPSSRVAIVDPETLDRLGPDRVGEIWVSDPAVARGYWQRSEESEQTFRATIANTGEGPFLRTGDLGFIKDDELFIAGRVKDLIIIRGTNHHPQDLEWSAQAAQPALRPENGAAFSVVVDGEEKLVLAQEVEREHVATLNVDSIAMAVRRAIAESHDLDLFALLLLARGSLPKTASGKIKRQACRAFFVEGGSQVIGHWTAPLKDPSQLPEWLHPGKSNLTHTEISTQVMNSSIKHETPAHDGFASPDVSRSRADELIGWLRDYASTRINSRIMDERRCVPPSVMLDFGNHGLMGMQVPEAFGGLGLRYADALRVLEQLAAIDLTLAAIVFLNGTNGIRPIQYHATTAIRDAWLPRLAAGRQLASFALSEPIAGSNVGGVSAHAIPDGRGGWRIRGVKRWNSSAWAGIVSVFVRMTDETGRLGGLTGFAVPMESPGVRIGPEALTTGLRASIQNSLFFDDVAVGPDQLLGEVGKGMEVAEDALSAGRLCITAACLGGLKRCAQLIVRYASRRAVASGRLIDNPSAITALTHLTTVIGALESFKDQVARRVDDGRRVPPEIAMAGKVFGSHALNDAAADLMQLLGGRGYMENNLAPQILRDARVLSVGEGPNEPLTTQIGRASRLTTSIQDYLRAEPEGGDLADLLSASIPEIVERCLTHPNLGVDRTTGQLWADSLIGDLAIEMLLLAAVRESHRRSPADRVERLAGCLKIRLAKALQRARKGDPEERYLLRAEFLASETSSYRDAIGDLEQTLPGEEDLLDEYLKVDPTIDLGLPTGLPGRATVPSVQPTAPPKVDSLPADEKRKLLARLLQQRVLNARNID